jgi:surface antigen
MYQRTLAALGTCLCLTLAGCNRPITNEQTGQVIGGIAGGVLGSQVGRGAGRTAATIAGTMLGAYLGGRIGHSMDVTDRRQANDALEYNRTAQPASWQNPDTGNRYQVTPQRTYYEGDTPCREYSTKAWIDGREEVVYGTACRQADGSWQARN